jgi:hypothetical protein
MLFRGGGRIRIPRDLLQRKSQHSASQVGDSHIRAPYGIGEHDYPWHKVLKYSATITLTDLPSFLTSWRLEILGLREDDALLYTLVREMDDNAYLVADPLTFAVRACMTRSFESARRENLEFLLSTTQLAERWAEIIFMVSYGRAVSSILARVGVTGPPEYVGRSGFYDLTRDLKSYRSSRIHLLFDRGVALDVPSP